MLNSAAPPSDHHCKEDWDSGQTPGQKRELGAWFTQVPRLAQAVPVVKSAPFVLLRMRGCCPPSPRGLSLWLTAVSATERK